MKTSGRRWRLPLPKFTPSRPTNTVPKSTPTLSELVTPRSWLLFERLGLDGNGTAWLRDEMAVWPSKEGYLAFSKSVKGLCVVNDPAERTVKLIQDFINSAHEEKRRQDVLLAVSASRKKHGTCGKKSSLAEMK